MTFVYSLNQSKAFKETTVHAFRMHLISHAYAVDFSQTNTFYVDSRFFHKKILTSTHTLDFKLSVYPASRYSMLTRVCFTRKELIEMEKSQKMQREFCKNSAWKNEYSKHRFSNNSHWEFFEPLNTNTALFTRFSARSNKFV